MFLLSGFVMPCVMLCLKAIHTRLLAADKSAGINGRTGAGTGSGADTIQTRLLTADNSTGTNASTETETETDTDTGTCTSADTETCSIATTNTDTEHDANASAPALFAAMHIGLAATHAVERLLNPLLRPIVAQSDEKSSPKQGVELGALFPKIRFQTQLINATTLLLTFGLVFPPLAVVICVAVVSETCFTQVLMARLLAEAEAASAATGRLYRQQLERDTEGMFLRK
jgi:hypothetical protein